MGNELDKGLTAITSEKNTDKFFLSFFIMDGRLYSREMMANWRLEIWQDILRDLNNENRFLKGYGYNEIIPAMDLVHLGATSNVILAKLWIYHCVQYIVRFWSPKIDPTLEKNRWQQQVPFYCTLAKLCKEPSKVISIFHMSSWGVPNGFKWGQDRHHSLHLEKLPIEGWDMIVLRPAPMLLTLMLIWGSLTPWIRCVRPVELFFDWCKLACWTRQEQQELVSMLASSNDSILRTRPTCYHPKSIQLVGKLTFFLPALSYVPFSPG